MMKTIAITFLAVILTFPIFAGNQSPSSQVTPEEKAQSKLEYLGIVLDLTEKQSSEISKHQASHVHKINNIKTEYQPIIDKMKVELKEIRGKSEDNFGFAQEDAKDVREKYKVELEPMKISLKTEKDNLQAAVKSLLNPTQLTKYEALIDWKERNKPMKHKPRPHGGHGK